MHINESGLKSSSVTGNSLISKIEECTNDCLEAKNWFQIRILECARIPEENWAKFLLGKTENSLSNQLRKYYCLNLCNNRQNCESAQEKGWVNLDFDYSATFLNTVYVIPNRANPEKPYELIKIH